MRNQYATSVLCSPSFFWIDFNQNLSDYSFEEVSGGGHSRDEPLISERDKRELMSLAQENISMDFILEMREAFQLFDKVS